MPRTQPLKTSPEATLRKQNAMVAEARARQKEPSNLAPVREPSRPEALVDTENEPTSSTRAGSRPHAGIRQSQPPAVPHPDTGEIFLPVAHGLCWQCGHPGHRQENCQGKPLLFCSCFGRIGVMSSQCLCIDIAIQTSPQPQPGGSAPYRPDAT